MDVMREEVKEKADKGEDFYSRGKGRWSGLGVEVRWWYLVKTFVSGKRL